MTISGCVSRPRMRLITQLRFFSEKMSINLSALPCHRPAPLRVPGEAVSVAAPDLRGRISKRSVRWEPTSTAIL